MAHLGIKPLPNITSVFGRSRIGAVEVLIGAELLTCCELTIRCFYCLCSMASVCGGCLAMLDAGVPLKSPVAGIAMGLILNTRDCGGDGEPLILSDILGSEDALGDMDFKVIVTTCSLFSAFSFIFYSDIHIYLHLRTCYKMFSIDVSGRLLGMNLESRLFKWISRYVKQSYQKLCNLCPIIIEELFSSDM